MSDIYIAESDIEHWMKTFSLTRAEAVEETGNWRSDYSRDSLSQAAWNMIKGSSAASGYTKESYEFSLSCGRSLTQKQNHMACTDNAGIYLLRVEEPATALRIIQELRGNTDKIEVVFGLDDDGNSVRFCYMTAQIKRLFESNFILSTSIHFRPAFTRVSVAKKDISDSRYLTLEIDSTLPQHRAHFTTDYFQPQQNEYPVWHFFYGILADRDVLARVIGVPDERI